jgi:hypothetical protein
VVWGNDNNLVTAREATQSAAMTMDRNQAFAALVLAATALFLFSVAPGVRFRRQARIAAIAVFGATFLGVAIYVVLWALGIVG